MNLNNIYNIGSKRTNKQKKLFVYFYVFILCLLVLFRHYGGVSKAFIVIDFSI